MNLLCQGAGGLWTGLGWATRVGGQALIRSHGPPRLVGGVDRSLSGQHRMVRQPVCLGQTPPKMSGRLGEVFVGLAGDVTFETPHDLCGVEPFVSSSCHVSAGLFIR